MLYTATIGGKELVRLMANLAPWRLAKAVLQGKRCPRLLLFSGQQRQSKVCVLLERGGEGLCLVVDYSGSNERLPQSRFCRKYKA